ncbi:uncharacterized protein BJ212DRAFT_1204417, partial [Suillus subaureus]
TNINKFIKLDWVSSMILNSFGFVCPSFKRANQLFGWINVLPSGLEWQSTTLEFTNYTTKRLIELSIWYDGFEVVKDLFANPIFSNYMMYDP